MKDKRKGHGALDKRSSDQFNGFVNPTRLPLLCEKTGALAIVEPGLTAGRQSVSPAGR